MASILRMGRRFAEIYSYGSGSQRAVISRDQRKFCCPCTRVFGGSHNSLRRRVLSRSAHLYIHVYTTSAKIYGHLKAMPPPGCLRPTFSGALRYVQHEKKTKRSICEIEIYGRTRARTLQANCLSFRNEV